MAQRINSLAATFNDQPFSGSGASLYAARDSATVQFRNLRIVGRGRRRAHKIRIKGTVANHDIAAASVLKTARVATVAHPATQFVWAIPAIYANSELRTQVRTYKDHVENLILNYRTWSVDLDGARDPIIEIRGSAVFLFSVARAGGIVWITIRYDPSLDGVQPNRFRLTRTAGPTSPADVLASYRAGQQTIRIETLALSDASPYTFDIIAEESVSATTKTVITGLSITADATGPIAPTFGSTSTK